MFKPKSTTQITLICFGLVVIPLFLALIFSVYQLDNIDQKLSETLEKNAEVSLQSKGIYNIINGLERSAKQYIVLKDIEILENYNELVSQLEDRYKAIERLNLPPEIITFIHQLSKDTQNVRGNLFDKDTKQINALSSIFSRLRATDDKLSDAIQEYSKQSISGLISESKRIKNMLSIMSILLIPSILLLIAYFSRIINKPIGQLRVAIEKIGKQHLEQPIKVSGPKNLQILGRRLEWLRVQLKELDSQKKQFLQHVSHELKTPLTAIREGTELLSDQVIGPLNEKQHEVTDILKTNSKQLQHQIEDLLAYNKTIVESDITRRIELPLNEVITEAIDEQKLSIKGRKLKIKTSLKSISLKVDPEQMWVIFRNLLSNAIKYSPPGGEIKISLKEKTSYAEFNIEDSGPGIHIEEREEVFSAFYKGKKDGTGYMKGTGLGLAIVKQFIDFHKGEIKLIDSNRGAHFRIRLPI